MISTFSKHGVSFLVLFVFANLTGQAILAADTPEARVSHFTCAINVALASTSTATSILSATTREPDSLVGSFSGKNSSKTKTTTMTSESNAASLIGRGVANCKNQQGFEFNLPTIMSISLNSAKPIPVQSVRASVEPVSVDRDVNLIFDQYDPHVILNETPTMNPKVSPDRAVIVRGEKNDVLLQVNLSLPADFESKVTVSKVDLKFDSEPLELQPRSKTE